MKGELSANGLRGRSLKQIAAIGFAAWLLGIQPAMADTGWYTQAQADKGHQLFNNYCAQCHRPDLTGAAGPALVGKSFLASWSNKALGDLYTFEHANMPATNPGSLSPDLMWTITAYILQKNGFAAGTTALGDNASSRVLASK